MVPSHAVEEQTKMPDNDLTPVQRFVLLSLMINATSLPNTAVSNSLKADKRNDLVKRGLIEVVGKPMQLELTQKGHDRALLELAAQQPEKTGMIGFALYSALGFLHRLIEGTGADPRALFRLRDLPRVTEARTAPASNDLPAGAATLEERVRKAYAELVGHPGGHVMVADVRDALPDVARSELDVVLVRMNLSADVHLTPESNQKALTARERAGAVHIGNQQRHLLAIVS
jgi:hypothetical protein